VLALPFPVADREAFGNGYDRVMKGTRRVCVQRRHTFTAAKIDSRRVMILSCDVSVAVSSLLGCSTRRSYQRETVVGESRSPALAEAASAASFQVIPSARASMIALFTSAGSLSMRRGLRLCLFSPTRGCLYPALFDLAALLISVPRCPLIFFQYRSNHFTIAPTFARYAPL
jgi:hypothetical protein